MLKEFWKRFNTYAAHFQMLVIVIAGLCIVCISWSVEKILEKYIVNDTLSNYAAIIGIGLLILWYLQHFIRKVI